MSFGKESDAVLTGDGSTGAPFVAGLSPERAVADDDRTTADRVLDAARRLEARHRSHRVSGAVVALEVPVARDGDRSRPTRHRHCSTSAPEPGTTGFAVSTRPRSAAAEMAWSAPVRVKVARPTFSISVR